MTRNPYVDLCLSVQAVRRHFESVRTPLAPAVGVAASLYTHQLANVLRVLTDVRVRHLLADEVGLGKTVQALMVLNALRTQRPDLQALIVVPDRLVPQWRDEIMTRAHTAPFDEGGDVLEGRQYIRLAWEAQLRMIDPAGHPRLTLSDIDSSRFDVLVVDELHSQTSTMQDRIVRVASKFRHVLILTATPKFQDLRRHAQLFAILEPERVALSRSRIASSARGLSEQLSVGDDLSNWPEWAAATVVDDILERDRIQAECRGTGELAAAALVSCAYRRVLRTRREDYSGVLPRRYHRPLVVEPLGAETERQALMWRYVSRLDELSTRFDPVLLAKRVILSPPSLEQRVDFLRRKGHDRDGLLERVKPLVHRRQGDSRADALIDLLMEVWSHDPRERILVAAQDNLTVDYLFDLVRARLSIVGPLGARVPLVAARVRQGMMTEAVEDLGGFGNETNENLEAFQRGEAQVLFAPEAAQVGLNLQRARVLVLYSVPWRPEEVEQWIGRLDRIGNAAAFSHDGGAKTIEVFTIVHRGLVDEKVVQVLQRFQVFERSVNLDGDHIEEVTQRIEAAALRPESVNWREVEDSTEVMAAEDEVQELESALRPYLPWTVRRATSERDRLDAMPPAPPVLKELSEHSGTGPRSWDQAFEGMLKLLQRAGEYHIRWKTDPHGAGRFRTLWYRFGEKDGWGHREVCSKVVLSFGADPGSERSPLHAHAFITRRGDVQTPPRRSVTLCLRGNEALRPLRFLSFGDPLHDELVHGWLPRDNAPAELDVAFFDDHAVFERGTPGLYVLRVSILDPAAALRDRDIEWSLEEALTGIAAHRSLERLLDLVPPFMKAMHCALDADVRWLRAHLTATMALEVRRRQRDQWIPADAEETRALLNPMAHNRNDLPRATGPRIPEALVTAAHEELRRLRGADAMAAPSAWGPRLPDFVRALEARLLIVTEERNDAIALSSEELRRTEDLLREAMERGNRAQISRAEHARQAAEDVHSMSEVFWEHRVRWLQECREEVRRVQPNEHLQAILNARRAT